MRVVQAYEHLNSNLTSRRKGKEKEKGKRQEEKARRKDRCRGPCISSGKPANDRGKTLIAF